MNFTLTAVLAVLAAYLIGSLSLARTAARAQGVEITEEGSGNPGATNVARTLGRQTGALVLVGDLLKGLAGGVLGAGLIEGELGGWIGGAAAVLGHCYPVFYRFRGGKGVATAGGMILSQSWLLTLALTVVWALMIRVFKISSVASLVIVGLAVPGVWLATRSVGATAIMAGVALLILLRHRENLARLRDGNEGSIA